MSDADSDRYNNTELGPDVGEPDFWITDRSSPEWYDADNERVFALEEGEYDIEAVDLKRQLSEISDRAAMAILEDKNEVRTVFLANGRYCSIDVTEKEPRGDFSDEVTVNVEKGDYSDLVEDNDHTSRGYLERIIDEQDVEEDELERQRRANLN